MKQIQTIRLQFIVAVTNKIFFPIDFYEPFVFFATVDSLSLTCVVYGNVIISQVIDSQAFSSQSNSITIICSNTLRITDLKTRYFISPRIEFFSYFPPGTPSRRRRRAPTRFLP